MHGLVRRSDVEGSRTCVRSYHPRACISTRTFPRLHIRAYISRELGQKNGVCFLTLREFVVSLDPARRRLDAPAQMAESAWNMRVYWPNLLNTAQVVEVT